MANAHRSETNQIDSDIDRDRGTRRLVAFLSPVIVFLLGYWIGAGLVSFFKLPSIIGTGLGLGLGAFGVISLIPRLYVVNEAIAAFVTVDLIAKELVSYGPGFHFSYPWEARSGTNNVNLEESAENYEVDVMTKNGTLKVKFSGRFRPDIRLLPNFLGGVASLASELGDLIRPTITEFFAPMDVREALTKSSEINKKLGEFKDGHHDFETRFGIMVGDVTVGNMLVTKEIQDTLGALTESRLIDQAVAESYGYESIRDVEAAIKARDLDREDVNRRRTQAMAMSGNLQGMDLKETTTNFRIQGLDKIDPKLAEAVVGLAPALNALLASRRGQSASGKDKSTS